MMRRLARVQWSLAVVCLLLATILHSANGISSPKNTMSSLKSNNKKVVDRLNKDAIRGGNAATDVIVTGWGDHPIATPATRWKWCAGYWVVCALAAHFMGTIDYALKQEWLAPNAWYVVHLILHLPLYLGTWDWSAFAFNRPFRFFASIVYPLMHNLDTLMWFAVFDFGKLILSKLYSGDSKLVQFLAGWGLYAVFIAWHRGSLELRCLPEHHPEPSPVGRGNKLAYVLAGIIISIPTMLIYHIFGDMRWGMMLQYSANLYFAIRMRLSDPWDKYDDADKVNYEQRWLPYMNEKSY